MPVLPALINLPLILLPPNSITIGGVKASILTLTKNLVVSGDFIISANGVIDHPESTLMVKGDWVNNGTYTTSHSSSKAIFGGNSQLISGSSTTTFRDLVINVGSIVALGANAAKRQAFRPGISKGVHA